MSNILTCFEESKVKFMGVDYSSYTITFSGYIDKIKKRKLYLIPNQIEITVNE